MATEACARCGRQVPDSQLLFSDVGRVCGSCEAELGEAEGASAARYALAVSGPLFAFGSFVTTFAMLVPVVGLIAAGLAPLLAILALVLGVRALLGAEEADGLERTGAVVGGALGALGGFVMLGLSGVSAVATVIALASRGF